jgi:hypothetical protein
MVQVRNPSGEIGSLSDVACLSARDCIAAGSAFTEFALTPLLYTWNGNFWDATATPRLVGDGLLNSVVLVDGTGVAVGNEAPGPRTLIEQRKIL